MRADGGEFHRLGEPAPEGAGRAARRTERLTSAARPEFAARGVGGILDVGLELLRARFAACVGVCAVLWLAPSWLTAYMPPETLAQRFVADPTSDVVAIWGLAGSFVSGMIHGFVQALALMTVASIVRGEFFGERVSAGEALLLVVRRVVPLTATALLVMVMTMAGMAACFLPYFYLAWKLALAPMVCALEKRGPIDSLSRSFALTQGSFPRWLGFTVVAGVLVFPLSSMIGAGAAAGWRDMAIDALALDPTVYALVLWLAGTLFLAVATAATAAIAAAYYYDCMVRREALDLRERLRALAPARSAA